MEVNNLNKLEQFKSNLLVILEHLEAQNIVFMETKEQFIKDVVLICFEVVDKYCDICPNIDYDALFQEVYECILVAAIGDKSKFRGGCEMYVKMAVKTRIEALLLSNRIDMHLTRENTDFMRKYLKLKRKLTKKLKRCPTDMELSLELDKSIDEVSKAGVIVDMYKNSVNLSHVCLEEDENYLSLDNYGDDFKDLVHGLIEKANLSAFEEAVLCLHYGIVPVNKKSINLDGKVIVFDGVPKSLCGIGDMFSYTDERISQLLDRVYYKLVECNYQYSFGLTSYAENPDLASRLQDIYNWTKSIPFTKKYPTIGSYFKEYSTEEIYSILNEMSMYTRNFMLDLDRFERNVTGFNYGIREHEKLFRIIIEVYNSLINKYGRRAMVTDVSDCRYVKYGHSVDKFRDFYGYFSLDDHFITLGVVSNLNDNQRGILQQVYGKELGKILKPSEILEVNAKSLASCYTLLRQMIAWIDEAQVRISKLGYNSNIKYSLENISSSIYDVFSSANALVVEDAMDELFEDELVILKKVFGDDFSGVNAARNLEKLSFGELNVYDTVMARIDRFILAKKNDEASLQRKQKRIESFYRVFIVEGYGISEIRDVLSSDAGSVLMKEYFKRGTSFERREEIIKMILKMLYDEYDEGLVSKLLSGQSYVRQKTMNI